MSCYDPVPRHGQIRENDILSCKRDFFCLSGAIDSSSVSIQTPGDMPTVCRCSPNPLETGAKTVSAEHTGDCSRALKHQRSLT